MFNEKITNYCNDLLSRAEQEISEERRLLLIDIAKFLKQEINADNPIELVYLCTHNSRRSHFSQVWGHIGSLLFGFSEIKTFSGGTVATACHPNTIKALRNIGFVVTCENFQDENPLYKVYYNDHDFIECYSKANTDDVLPQSDFVAVMTCSDADENCPLVPGAKKRFSTTYDDPKEFDGMSNAVDYYEERSLQIAQEALYTFRYLSALNANQ
jgi:protein-tyrosine-phosphatase